MEKCTKTVSKDDTVEKPHAEMAAEDGEGYCVTATTVGKYMNTAHAEYDGAAEIDNCMAVVEERGIEDRESNSCKAHDPVTEILPEETEPTSEVCCPN